MDSESELQSSRRQHAAQRPLRPVMLSPQFLPETFGGAEQQALRLSQALVRRGHHPVILTSRSDPKTPMQSLMNGVLVTRLTTPDPPQFGGRRLRSTYLWFRQVRRYFQEMQQDIDVIHCHQAKLNAWIGVRMGAKYGIPVLVKPGSAGPNFDLRRLEKKRFVYGRMAARDIAVMADRFISISSEMTEDLCAFNVDRSRIVQLPNGIPYMERRAELYGPKLRCGATETVFLFAGRMERQKNVETLISALARLQRRDWSAVFLGDGSGLSAAQNQANALGIAKNCIFAGRVSDVFPWLAMSDFFVLPALAEGMSNALLEAMASGCIPIASRVSGNTDLISDPDCGFLYGAPRDEAALSKALATALQLGPEKRRKMSDAAREKVAKDNSMDEVADRYTALYRTLLSRSVEK